FPPAGAGDAPVEGKLTPVLEGLVGTWETATDVKVVGRALTVKGKDVVETAYGGTFVRGVATNEMDNRGLVLLTTFDPAMDRYRLWMYDSLGIEIEWTGVYDEKAQSIRWAGALPDGVTGAMNWKLAAGGGYTWDLAITSNGKPLLEIKGDHTK